MQPTSHAIAIAIALPAMLLLSACVSPVEGLWPPAQDLFARTVIVSLDTWHAMIAFPTQQEDSGHLSSEEGVSTQHSPLRTPYSYEE